MVDSISEAIRTCDPTTAVESMNQLFKLAEGIEKTRYVMELLRAGVQLGAELDDQIKKKKSDLDIQCEMGP